MFTISCYNKQVFDINTENYDFKKLSELWTGKSEIFILNGFYLNEKSQFGRQYVAINKEFKILINMPAHLNGTFDTMILDLEAVEAIKNEKVGFYIKPYSRKGQQNFSVVFVDL